MAVVTLLAEALRGNVTTGPLTVPAGQPAHVRIVCTSPTFPTDATLTFELQVDRSVDGGATFNPYFGMGPYAGGLAGTATGKNGAIVDGLPRQIAQTDGLACVLRVRTLVNKPFIYGITGEALP